MQKFTIRRALPFILYLSLLISQEASTAVGVSVDYFGTPTPTACHTGSFLNPESHLCQSCTQPCPAPLVEISACRRSKDAVCRVTSPASHIGHRHAITRRRVMTEILCPADSFFDGKSGRCRECRRFCFPPLVMTSPCMIESDAECGQPSVDDVATTTRKPARNKKFETSRRRKGSQSREKAWRRKKNRSGKKRKERLPPRLTLTSSSSSHVCTDENQFYNLERGRCFTCRICDYPGHEEHLPCTSTSDRVCRRLRHHLTRVKGIDSTDNHGIDTSDYGANELPQDSTRKEVQINRLNNNEFPVPDGTKIADDNRPPLNDYNSSKNFDSGRQKAVVDPESVRSNSAEITS